MFDLLISFFVFHIWYPHSCLCFLYLIFTFLSLFPIFYLLIPFFVSYIWSPYSFLCFLYLISSFLSLFNSYIWYPHSCICFLYLIFSFLSLFSIIFDLLIPFFIFHNICFPYFPPFQFIAVLSVFFIIASTVCLTVSTIPSFDQPDQKLHSTTSLENWNTSRTNHSGSSVPVETDVLDIVEAVCVGWFTFEYVVRLWASPSKRKFFRSPLNFIDLVAIIPYYLSLLLAEAHVGNAEHFQDAR